MYLRKLCLSLANNFLKKLGHNVFMYYNHTSSQNVARYLLKMKIIIIHECFNCKPPN